MDKIFRNVLIYGIAFIFVTNTVFSLLLVYNFYAPTSEGFELSLEDYKINYDVDNTNSVNINISLENLYSLEIKGLIICENYKEESLFFYNVDLFEMSELSGLKFEINYIVKIIPDHINIRLETGHENSLSLKIIL